MLEVLTQKKTVLKKTGARVLLKDEHGNGNPYSVLIAQECLGDVIQRAETPDDQLTAIHKTATDWLRVLFDDGKLERAFKKSRLDSGMA